MPPYGRANRSPRICIPRERPLNGERYCPLERTPFRRSPHFRKKARRAVRFRPLLLFINKIEEEEGNRSCSVHPPFTWGGERSQPDRKAPRPPASRPSGFDVNA
jgi:hypothetical protein